MSIIRPFHVAVPVHDLSLARNFYGNLLGCEEGRSDSQWVDYNLYGHQFVVHLKEGMQPIRHHFNPVDGHGVPVPHFGVVLEMEEWEKLAARLKQNNIKFIIEPYIRFKGLPGEQATLFFLDPSGNALEFKAFKDINQLFAK
jgi:uncharacterized protein